MTEKDDHHVVIVGGGFSRPFRDRLAVALSWLWIYSTGQRSARLITGTDAGHRERRPQ